MKKVVCLGQATYDMSLIVEDFPRESTKNTFQSKVGCGGGTAANCAYLLGRWAYPATFAGVIGNDVYGNRIKAEFSSVGLDTRFIENSFTKDTTLSMIILNKKNKTRTFFNVSDGVLTLKKLDFDFSPEVVFIDGYDFAACKQLLDIYPKTTSVFGVNVATREMLELAKRVTYLVCSQAFAQSVTGVKIDFTKSSTLVNLYQALKEKFERQEIIITLGDKGCIYFLNHQIKISPALKVNVEDPTGAGDVFYGAFTYGIANDYDVEKSVKFANIAAGLSLRSVGARLSIPKLEEVQKIYEQNY